ncbi:cytochrome b [Aestuariispira insulae]|uniref:Cytochrome b561 n=1 Tax=Aestuariispira insulae TaxID=1461337 RepID=A0A3D9HML2_9PROT|nr:cytochrome b [Aestuariispira insulae]RED50740.1 cytochrome b561 [Aestuariispira insulae]
MALKNTKDQYGSVAKWMHWISALTIIGLFALGLWMRSLSYYDPWYKDGPDLHRSIGVVLAVLILARLVWRWMNPQPHDPAHARWERVVASWTHGLFYVLLFALFIAGFLISTADGRSMDVFGLFSIPSVIKQAGLEKTAGEIHEILAFTVIGLAVFHVIGALKHHVIDKDRTLLRMLPERKK